MAAIALRKILADIKAKLQADPDCALATLSAFAGVIDDGSRFITNRSEAAQKALDQAKAEIEGLGTEIKTEVLTEIRTGNPLEEVLRSGETHDISAIATCPGKTRDC